MTTDPIFKSVFGKDWEHLPSVMHKHYTNRPFTNDTYSCVGKMDVKAHILMRLFAPLSHMLGGIPIANQSDIPVKVIFKSTPFDDHLHFVRTFQMRDRKPYIFHSEMIPTGDNKITEVMKMGLCWQSKFKWQNNKVILAHNGYAVKLFGRLISLPLTWLIGHIHAEEEATSEIGFKMFVEINHWLFGKLYEYRGEFTMETAGIDDDLSPAKSARPNDI
ncbi:DUF4166 domain-containing protein [Kordiimonas sp. SCSIO 12610]|uniref:DUF4166 domain-containing protein n=1 Tax=Kordiimonas sp. SCSIO 12610 TaxID=2829597 RepID=UPI00210D5354|nr:DUF4166 domain-containing protein [Kordiimonas sp. SCSIO 12610]UTW56378.1 DUF4166 domain-containing protein [Kordiimonas sp. SCSIO 12610]